MIVLTGLRGVSRPSGGAIVRRSHPTNGHIQAIAKENGFALTFLVHERGRQIKGRISINRCLHIIVLSRSGGASSPLKSADG